MRKVVPVALTVILLLSVIILVREGHAQTGPRQDTFTIFATYQFHVLKNPTGLAIPSLSDGNIYIADSGNNVIRKFSFSSGTLSIVAGTGTAGYIDSALNTSQFNGPTGIVATHATAAATHTGGPYSWTVLYVNDAVNHAVRGLCFGSLPSFNPSNCGNSVRNKVGTIAGGSTQGFVDGTGTAAQFAAMAGLSSPNSSLTDLYVADSQNHAIRDLASTIVTTYCGNGSPGFVNGPRASSQWNAPTKAAWDGNGNMYVSDTGNSVIRKIDGTGNVTTFSGSGQFGYADGSATVAQFRTPTGMAYNAADAAVYVADTRSNVIRRVDSAGNVTTYAGTGTSGLVNGSLSQAQFNCPTDIVISNGFLYVSDSCNNAIRRIDMAGATVSTYIN
ncbi:MAG: repeat containing protein [Candidatus Angelobacter sp.]|nr:repeat containing protein [Candidatus Angelobacter sp.]